MRAPAAMLLLVSLSGIARGAGADFKQDVLPILKKHCLDCHGPDEQESNLRLDSMTAALSGGDIGEPVIVPGSSDRSYLVTLVTSEDDRKRMPPDGDRLSQDEVSTLKAWIDDADAWTNAQQEIENEKHDHWSFQPLQHPQVHQLDGHPIDAFIKRKLDEAGIAFSRRADRPRLIRRLFLVLHGLPPSPQQVAAFVNDDRPDAWENLVERVLSSPRYGERMAMHWLDLARFGETHGFETNRERPNAWHYRDWVIDAFNSDMAYDEFVIAQLAGDAVGQDLGTGFIVAGPHDLVKGQDPKLGLIQRQDELADMINATGTAFLGLTLGCARCHNHKFDPITQTDYYALQAVFAGVNHSDRRLPRPDAETKELAEIDHRIIALRRQLSKFVPQDPSARLVIDDETMLGAAGAGVEHLASIAGHGTNPNGTDRGFAEDPGAARRASNISGGRYTWWKNQPGRDVLVYRPAATGRYRVWLSWGAGYRTHTDDARYYLDGDGDLSTKHDQTEIARVNQKLFADGSGKVVGKPLWSGLYDAGIHSLSSAASIVLRCGESGTAITADVLMLEPVDGSAKGSSGTPRVRRAVTTKQNVETIRPTKARFVRLTLHQSNSGEPCIDELEVYCKETNIALAKNGAKASSGGDFVHPLHKLQHINDGQYGNEKSWIAKQRSGGWVQIEFDREYEIDQMVWGRDRLGKYADRVAIDYTFEVSLDGKTWSTVATSADRLPFRTADPKPAYAFDAFPAQLAAAGRRQLEDLNRLNARKKVLQTGTKHYGGTFTQPGPTYRLYRGEPEQPREQVAPDAIAALGRLRLANDTAERDRRLALAKWVASERNPLTARVMVNRLWQFHFGTGLVDTPSDFGGNGTRPTHPQLLDWLAAELIQSGWSLQHVHRLIVTSQTWQQDSRPNDQALAIDGGSRLLWRFPPRRLEAEAIRDSILAVTGKLSLKAGGPGFSAFQVEMENVRHYHPKQEFGPDDWRRMIYMTKVRQERDSVFGVFDCPDGSQVAPKRSRSTTPLQALNLLNSRFVNQQAEFLAQRLEREAKTAADQIRLAYQLCYSTVPDADDIANGEAFIAKHGLIQFARAILNTNRLVFIT